MNESGAPLWLQLAIASIPLLVALIGGAFALNTINNRVERLKNLVEIWKGIPRVLNQDHAVERVMIQELNAIEKSTTPWRAQYRGQYILALLVLYVAGFLHYFNGHLFKLSNIADNIAQVAMTASGLYFAVGYWVWRNRLKEMKDQQEARLKLLDSLPALPERPETESPPTEADRSQANDAKATDATSDTTRTPTHPAREIRLIHFAFQHATSLAPVGRGICPAADLRLRNRAALSLARKKTRQRVDCPLLAGLMSSSSDRALSKS